MLVTSENWWAKTEWTDEHYKLARRLMRGIHVLPPDCGDDVVQEVAMRYSKARNAGKGGTMRLGCGRCCITRPSICIERNTTKKDEKREQANICQF